MSYERPETVTFEEIRLAFFDFCNGLHDRYPSIALKRLKPLTIKIPDLKRAVVFSIGQRSFPETDYASAADLERQLAAAALLFRESVWLPDSGRLGPRPTGEGLHQLADASSAIRLETTRRSRSRPKYLFSRKTILFSSASDRRVD